MRDRTAFGVASDLIEPQFGTEALRWSLALALALALAMSTYVVGIVAFAMAIRPYQQQVQPT